MPTSVSFHDLNPVSFLDRSAMVYPGKTAVVYGDSRLTYSELDERVNRLAGALRGAGIRRGDRVAFLCPNIPAMLEGHYGPMRIGAVLVAINIRLSGREITHILNHSGARVLVVDSEFAPTVRQILGDLETVETVVQVEDVAQAFRGDSRTHLRGVPGRRAWRRAPGGARV